MRWMVCCLYFKESMMQHLMHSHSRSSLGNVPPEGSDCPNYCWEWLKWKFREAGSGFPHAIIIIIPFIGSYWIFLCLKTTSFSRHFSHGLIQSSFHLPWQCSAPFLKDQSLLTHNWEINGFKLEGNFPVMRCIILWTGLPNCSNKPSIADST